MEEKEFNILDYINIVPETTTESIEDDEKKLLNPDTPDTIAINEAAENVVSITNKVLSDAAKKEIDLTRLGPDNSDWDVAYDTAINLPDRDDNTFYKIKITKPGEDNQEVSGFVKIAGKSGQELGDIITADELAQADMSEIPLVKEEGGSVFTGGDVDKFTQQLKSTSGLGDIKSWKIEKVLVSKGTAQASMDIIIRNMYFSACVKGGPVSGIDAGAANWLAPAANILNTICLRADSPLVGNGVFRVLAEAYKSESIRTVFKPQTDNVRILFNLIEGNHEVELDDIIQKKTVEGRLCYNPHLYRYEAADIDKIFNYYNKVADLDLIKANKSIKTALDKGGDQRQLALNVITKFDKDDPVTAILNGNTEVHLADIKTTLENTSNTLTLLTIDFRQPTEIAGLVKQVSGQQKGDEDELENKSGKNYYLIDSLVNKIKVSEGNIFKNVILKQGRPLSVYRLTESEASSIYSRPKNGDLIAASIASGNLKTPTADYFYIKNNQLYAKTNTPKDAKGKDDLKNADELQTDIQIKLSEIEKGVAITEINILKKPVKVTDYDIDTEGPEDNNDKETPETQSQTETPESGKKIETNTISELESNGYIEELDPVTQGHGVLSDGMIRGVDVHVGDVITGHDGKYYIVQKSNIGDGKWDVKEGTKIYRIKKSVLARLNQLGYSVMPGQFNGKLESLKEHWSKAF